MLHLSLEKYSLSLFGAENLFSIMPTVAVFPAMLYGAITTTVTIWTAIERSILRGRKSGNGPLTCSNFMDKCMCSLADSRWLKITISIAQWLNGSMIFKDVLMCLMPLRSFGGFQQSSWFPSFPGVKLWQNFECVRKYLKTTKICWETFCYNFWELDCILPYIDKEVRKANSLLTTMFSHSLMLTMLSVSTYDI